MCRTQAPVPDRPHRAPRRRPPSAGVWHTPVAAPLPRGAGAEARGPLANSLKSTSPLPSTSMCLNIIFASCGATPQLQFFSPALNSAKSAREPESGEEEGREGQPAEQAKDQQAEGPRAGGAREGQAQQAEGDSEAPAPAPALAPAAAVRAESAGALSWHKLRHSTGRTRQAAAAPAGRYIVTHSSPNGPHSYYRQSSAVHPELN